MLINERIREEVRSGKSPRAAVDSGYERALPAILDSNITTFLAGVILFQFGTGPVKGFAVTLCVGIFTTVLTAVFGTRIYYDYRLAIRRLTDLELIGAKLFRKATADLSPNSSQLSTRFFQADEEFARFTTIKVLYHAIAEAQALKGATELTDGYVLVKFDVDHGPPSEVDTQVWALDDKENHHSQNQKSG